MGPIAIVGALHEELSAVLALMPDAQQQIVGRRIFCSGHLHGHPVVAVLSGIGKVAAATTATALIERFGVARIVFTGVAGGVGDGVNVGDVVVAQDYLQHDMDASPLFPRWEVPGYARSRLVCDAALSATLLEAAHACVSSARGQFGLEYVPQSTSEDALHRAHHGLVASGDRFVSAADEAHRLRTTLHDAGHNVLAVEMEGAAVAQVCHDYGIPFAAVRTISDRADDTAHVDFPLFVQTVASRYAEHMVLALMHKL